MCIYDLSLYNALDTQFHRLVLLDSTDMVTCQPSFTHTVQCLACEICALYFPTLSDIVEYGDIALQYRFKHGS